MLSKPKQSKARYVEKEVDAGDEARLDEEFSDEDFEEGPSQRPMDVGLVVSDDEEIDADAPRVALWEEDNDDFLAEQGAEENKTSDEVCIRHFYSLRLMLRIFF